MGTQTPNRGKIWKPDPLLQIFFWWKMGPMSRDFLQKVTHFGETSLSILICEHPSLGKKLSLCAVKLYIFVIYFLENVVEWNFCSIYINYSIQLYVAKTLFMFLFSHFHVHIWNFQKTPFYQLLYLTSLKQCVHEHEIFNKNSMILIGVFDGLCLP